MGEVGNTALVWPPKDNFPGLELFFHCGPRDLTWFGKLGSKCLQPSELTPQAPLFSFTIELFDLVVELSLSACVEVRDRP